jgi:hypothetical protein
MRLKLILTVASMGLIGAVASGCVSEGGHYQDYRPAVVYKTQPQHVDHRRDRYKDHRRDRYNDHEKRARHDRDRSSHRSNDNNRRYNDRDRTGGHYKDCRPGTKDCRRPHM